MGGDEFQNDDNEQEEFVTKEGIEAVMNSEEDEGSREHRH